MTDSRFDPSAVPLDPPAVPPPPPAPLPPPFTPSSAPAVTPWPSEQPLLALLALVAAFVWLALIMSIIGIVYALLIGLFVFVSHLALIAHLRGSAVKLGPSQFPDLYRRVRELSAQIGLKEPPDAYVSQQGGALNAFATRFFSRSFIVLYSDLLDACGDNTEARDFVIAHELGHLHAGHLRFQGLLLPGAIVPFLWNAYSRAREFTCDRYGISVARDRQAALRGMAILAAGGRLGAEVRLDAFTQQRDDLNRPMMKLGAWLSTHPPLCDRLTALEPSLAAGTVLNQSRARVGALAIIGGVIGLPIVATAALMVSIMVAAVKVERAKAEAVAAEARETAQTDARILKDVEALRHAIEAFRATHDRLPAETELEQAWHAMHGERPLPQDPNWGEGYAYETNGVDYLLGSSGTNTSYQSANGGSYGEWEDLELPVRSSTPPAVGLPAPKPGTVPAPPRAPSGQ